MFYPHQFCLSVGTIFQISWCLPTNAALNLHVEIYLFYSPYLPQCLALLQSIALRQQTPGSGSSCTGHRNVPSLSLLKALCWFEWKALNLQLGKPVMKCNRYLTVLTFVLNWIASLGRYLSISKVQVFSVCPWLAKPQKKPSWIKIGLSSNTNCLWTDHLQACYAVTNMKFINL